MLARRCLPELFGDDLPLGRDFAAAIHGAGIKEIFLEGRVVTQGAVNVLKSVADEVDLLSGHYHEVKRIGAVSYLKAND
jgi:hypothetical protein